MLKENNLGENSIIIWKKKIKHKLGQIDSESSKMQHDSLIL